MNKAFNKPKTQIREKILSLFSPSGRESPSRRQYQGKTLEYDKLLIFLQKQNHISGSLNEVLTTR